jgi:tRNA A37 threonylcarbamoyladenosine dehydratase
MGAAGRLDPTAIRVSDLCESDVDQFAKDVRKYLHARHGLRCTEPTGILAVWSSEPSRPTLSRSIDALGIPGVRAPDPNGPRRRAPKCYGSAAFVTGVFGMTMASVAVRTLIGDKG